MQSAWNYVYVRVYTIILVKKFQVPNSLTKINIATLFDYTVTVL